MTVQNALSLAVKLLVLWTSVADLSPGEAGELPTLRLRIGRGYWELGPLPLRRLS